MKLTLLLLSVGWLTLPGVSAYTLPYFTAHPQNTNAAPGSDIVMSVASTNFTEFQWRFNGMDLPGATGTSLTITNVQTTNTGYYLVIAKNATGWSPSQLGYVAVVSTPAVVPFSNRNNQPAQVLKQGCDPSQPANGATAQVLAGPQLDQMVLVGVPRNVSDGYFQGNAPSVPNASPGQEVYVRVAITHTNPCWQFSNQVSTTLRLIAGGGTNPVPSMATIRFHPHLEWPDVVFPGDFGYQSGYPSNRQDQIKVIGENVNFTLPYFHYYLYPGYPDWHPYLQWRKDGVALPGATNETLVINNAQPADAGIYDAIVQGGYGEQATVSLKYSFSIVATNGQGALRSPRRMGPDFITDLEGAPTRAYQLLWSTNLTDWSVLRTITNTSGTTVLTNSVGAYGRGYFRTVLLP